MKRKLDAHGEGAGRLSELLCFWAGRQSEAFGPVVLRKQLKDSRVEASFRVPASAPTHGATDIPTAAVCSALVGKFGGLALQPAAQVPAPPKARPSPKAVPAGSFGGRSGVQVAPQTVTRQGGEMLFSAQRQLKCGSSSGHRAAQSRARRSAARGSGPQAGSEPALFHSRSTVSCCRLRVPEPPRATAAGPRVPRSSPPTGPHHIAPAALSSSASAPTRRNCASESTAWAGVAQRRLSRA